MKNKLRFKFLVFFYTSYLSIPSFLTSQPFLSAATVVRVGNDCTGYLLPETNYIWTLNQCLEYENTHGINSIKSKISIQKNRSELSASGINNTIMELDMLQNPTIIYKNKDSFTKTLELSEGSHDLAKIINNQEFSQIEDFLLFNIRKSL